VTWTERAYAVVSRAAALWTAAGYLLCVAVLAIDGARLVGAITGAP
jgi:hypothetical protein